MFSTCKRPAQHIFNKIERGQIYCQTDACLFLMELRLWKQHNRIRANVFSCLIREKEWMEILPPFCWVSACLEWRQEGRSNLLILPLPLQLWSTCHRKVPKHKSITQVKNKDLMLYRWRCGKELICQGRRHKRSRFNPQVWKMPWRRKWPPHSSIRVWRIPRTEEPDGLLPIGSQRVGRN